MNTQDFQNTALPNWLLDLLGVPSETAVKNGDAIDIRGQSFCCDRGILRQRSLVSSEQAQTRDVFGFKWHKRDTFEGEVFQDAMREWLRERYGDPATTEWLADAHPETVLLDAGCGAANSAKALLGDEIGNIRYLGVDISDAVSVASQRFAEDQLPGGFLQADLTDLPLSDASVDIVFSEGVLHHTDSTANAICKLARLIKLDGWMVFYVYRRKGPIREFTDDLIREKIQDLPEDEAWNALIPLTRLGHTLGELDIEIDVPEAIELLEIPAGPINLQRLFYWHIFKAYYRPVFSLDEMNHINFDWYAPKNAQRQSIEEVREWCASAGLSIFREHVEPAGITIWAQKTA